MRSPNVRPTAEVAGSDHSANLSVPESTDMVYVARFPGRKHIVMHMPVGARLPMFCTAAGRAYLAALPADEAQALLKASNFHAFTPTIQ